MTHKMKCLFFSIPFLLVVACVFFHLIEFPLGRESITDSAQYLEVNHYVEAALTDSFRGALPEKIPALAEVEIYNYSYSCAVFGNPEFCIILQVRFNDANEFAEERNRLFLLSADKSAPHEFSKIFLKGSPEEIRAYLDDYPQDGTRYAFEIVQVNELQKTILYFVSQTYDGQRENTAVTSFLWNAIA